MPGIHHYLLARHLSPLFSYMPNTVLFTSYHTPQALCCFPAFSVGSYKGLTFASPVSPLWSSKLCFFVCLFFYMLSSKRYPHKGCFQFIWCINGYIPLQIKVVSRPLVSVVAVEHGPQLQLLCVAGVALPGPDHGPHRSWPTPTAWHPTWPQPTPVQLPWVMSDSRSPHQALAAFPSLPRTCLVTTDLPGHEMLVLCFKKAQDFVCTYVFLWTLPIRNQSRHIIKTAMMFGAHSFLIRFHCLLLECKLGSECFSVSSFLAVKRQHSLHPPS